MKMSTQTSDLFLALSKAEAELKSPTKNKTAKVPTKKGGEYSYSYADLGNIVECSKGVLAKYGLAVTQVMDVLPECPVLVTLLTHSTGQWLSGQYPLPRDLSPQEMGSAITYGRRYSLCALLNIVAEDDDDADSITPPKQYDRGPSQPNTGLAPMCDCGNKMMISKRNPNEFYCMGCRNTRPKHA